MQLLLLSFFIFKYIFFILVIPAILETAISAVRALEKLITLTLIYLMNFNNLKISYVTGLVGLSIFYSVILK